MKLRVWPGISVLLVLCVFGFGHAAAAEGTANDAPPAQEAVAPDVFALVMTVLGDSPETPATPFLPPGHGGTPPGQGGTPPGQTTPPGQGGTPPGQGGGTPPGQGGNPPGDGNPPPGES